MKLVAVIALLALSPAGCYGGRSAPNSAGQAQTAAQDAEASGWSSPAAYRATRDAEAFYAAHREEILRAHPDQYVLITGGRVYAFPGASWVDAFDAAKGISPGGGGLWVGTWPRLQQ